MTDHEKPALDDLEQVPAAPAAEEVAVDTPSVKPRRMSKSEAAWHAHLVNYDSDCWAQW